MLEVMQMVLFEDFFFMSIYEKILSINIFTKGYSKSWLLLKFLKKNAMFFLSLNEPKSQQFMPELFVPHEILRIKVKGILQYFSIF